MHLKTDDFAASIITRKGSNKTSLQEFAGKISKIYIKIR